MVVSSNDLSENEHQCPTKKKSQSMRRNPMIIDEVARIRQTKNQGRPTIEGAVQKGSFVF